MKITKLQQNNYFTGIHIAKSVNCVKNMETSIDLYEITAKDKAFLKKLEETVKMRELMPADKGISHEGFCRWQAMLEVAIAKAGLGDRKCVIAVKDNKPCGIITYKPDKKTFNLDCICTWPVEAGKKVALAGQTLFKQMFSDFLKQKADFIELSAILNGPFPVVPKYMRLGFRQTGGKNFLIEMRTNNQQVKNTMKHLDDIIITHPMENSEDINLLETLDV